MSTLFLTLIIACVVCLIAVGLLGVSWLLTGKSSLRAGACGRDPTKKKSSGEGCGNNFSCDLCEKDDKKPKA